MKTFHAISACLTGVLLAGVFTCSPAAARPGKPKLHTLPVENIEQVRNYFRYDSSATAPIVSGHRGCRENGCPENSIRAYEYTLKHTPAFFEIDPRITKDSVIVIMHDPTLDRTTTGTGAVADHTWAEIRNLYLKDVNGNVTSEHIPTLDEVIRWSKGKTVINLDVYAPQELIAETLRKHGFPPHVMLTIHTPAQLQYYYEQCPELMFSVHINSLERLRMFEEAGIPWENVMVYVGPRMTPDRQELYERIRAEGARCMISVAPTHDRDSTPERRRAGYLSELPTGPDVIESDYPVELSEALREASRPDNR